MQIIDKCAFVGDLKPIWGELKGNRNGEPNYISGLGADDNHVKSPPDFTLANLTLHVRLHRIWTMI